MEIFSKPEKMLLLGKIWALPRRIPHKRNSTTSTRKSSIKRGPKKFVFLKKFSNTCSIQISDRENYIRRIEEENRILKEDLPRDQNRNYKRKNHSW